MSARGTQLAACVALGSVHDNPLDSVICVHCCNNLAPLRCQLTQRHFAFYCLVYMCPQAGGQAGDDGADVGGQGQEGAGQEGAEEEQEEEGAGKQDGGESEGENGLKLPVTAMPWLGLLGPAFKAVRKLCVRHTYEEDHLVPLDAAFFAGLEACSHLHRLKISSDSVHEHSWDLGADVAARPELLKVWLPRVRELELVVTSLSLMPLLHGLAPQLEVLTVWRSDDFEALQQAYSVELAPALASCSKLWHLNMQGEVSGAVLDVMLRLPSLKSVDLQQVPPLAEWQSTVGREGPQWEELSCWFCYSPDAVAALVRLAKVQRLQLQHLIMVDRRLTADDLDSMGLLHSSMQVLGGVRELSVAGLQLHICESELDEQAAADGVGGGVQRSTLPRLHSTIAALAPLAASMHADSPMPLLLCVHDDVSLGETTAAVLGGALG